MPESRKKLKMPIGIGIISILAVYLAIYMVLSAMGDYVECGRGLGGYRIYRWQPCTVKDHGRPTTLLYIFLPVYWVDIKWIHPEKDGWVPVKE